MAEACQARALASTYRPGPRCAQEMAGARRRLCRPASHRTGRNHAFHYSASRCDQGRQGCRCRRCRHTCEGAARRLNRLCGSRALRPGRDNSADDHDAQPGELRLGVERVDPAHVDLEGALDRVLGVVGRRGPVLGDAQEGAVMLADERRGTGAREGVGSLRPAAGHRTHRQGTRLLRSSERSTADICDRGGGLAPTVQAFAAKCAKFLQDAHRHRGAGG